MNAALVKYIAIGLAAVVVAGGAYLYSASSKAPEGEQNPQDSAADEEASGEAGSYSGSLADLLSRGGNWKCTFDHTVEGITSSGTVHISGSRLRGDFTSAIPQLGTPVESHMIHDGTYFYVWTSLFPQGFKSKASAGVAAEPGSGNVDINQQLDYSCAPWTEDASLFALPAGVEFIGN